MIHLTAIVGSGAKIGERVEIGPHTLIGGEVTIGDDTIIGANAVLEGEVVLGAGNRIGHGAIIGGAPQDVNFSEKTRSRVEIGARNVIREYCTIHRGTAEGSATKIGDDNFLMIGVHVGHNCVVGNKVIIANNVLLAGHVIIDDQAFIGGGTTFHQNMRVGRLVMVQGSSAFGKDLPPFTLAAERNAIFGLNVVGLRRAQFSAEQRLEIKRAFNLLYRSGLTFRDAVAQAKKETWSELGHEFFEFVAAALEKRGVCPLAKNADD
ncbi:MAG: acyl-ACP--UDP-N-acetylglucosamine O-acyltransferase [Verrucomicrobiota bacterium]|nr:acyl-ACP--UDP-N-acetylglucosamine O-acyltransferase [Verrucomicrobiota bacterium]